MSLRINYKLIESRNDKWFCIMNAWRFMKHLVMKALGLHLGLTLAHMVKYTKSLFLGKIEIFFFVVTVLMTTLSFYKEI